MRTTYDIITKQDCPTAVALGFFDGVHLGHRAVIDSMVQQATVRNLCPCVFTFMAGGSGPASKQGLTLLQSHPHKQQILSDMGVEELRCPDFADFKELSPESFVSELLYGTLGARLLVCGDNYHFGKYAAGSVTELRRLAEPLGIEVITVPPVLYDNELISSTRIRQALRDGHPELAEAMLGTPFIIEGEVTHGKRLGRTINSPTINQAIPPSYTVPMNGVYLSSVTSPYGAHYGVTNIGVRPTVGGEGINCETYLIGFEGDLYGQHVTTALRRLLRPEQRFDSVAELAEQIQQDIKLATQLAAAI